MENVIASPRPCLCSAECRDIAERNAAGELAAALENVLVRFDDEGVPADDPDRLCIIAALSKAGRL